MRILRVPALLIRSSNCAVPMVCIAFHYCGRRQHSYVEYFAPDYRLHLEPASMENMNEREYLEKCKINILANVGSLQAAPSVQFQEVSAARLPFLSLNLPFSSSPLLLSLCPSFPSCPPFFPPFLLYSAGMWNIRVSAVFGLQPASVTVQCYRSVHGDSIIVLPL
jgi:hypothetical protein